MSDVDLDGAARHQTPGAPDPRSLRVRLWIGLAVVVLVLAAVSIAAVFVSRPTADAGPLAVAAADQPGAATPACLAVMGAMPTVLAGQSRRTLVAAMPAVLAWGDPPFVVRCGLPTPAELTCSASLQVVDGVAWLQFSEIGQTTYLAADRSVRIAVTVPDGSGTGELQQVSDVIAATLPARQPCRSGVLLPTDG